jgi:antitoxin component YwqK of YwqJK toxin-antitoxin module
MKQLIVLFLLFPFLSNAQITDVKERDSCYFNYDNKGNRIKNMRGYAEWECGKLAGVIDCNEELSYDEASDLVLRQPKDMVNMAGAGKPFSGRCEMCFMNGKLQRRVTFLSGKENGIDTSYYQSGCPQVVRSHMQGVQTGTWTYYYDSTNYLAWEMNYYLGEKHGKHIFFTRDGDTTLWEVYQNGLLHGTKREYFEDSKIQKEVDYKNGIFDGFFKVYNEEGVIIEELKYKEGKRDGEAKYYYDDGTLLRTESWTLGVKNGSFKTFFYNGDVQVSENYKKGRMEGWFEEYHPGNIAKRRAKYEKDVLVEEHKYDEHGRETYSFGAPTGNQNEDDDAPVEVGKKKKKKEKKKKEKKNKSK